MNTYSISEAAGIKLSDASERFTYYFMIFRRFGTILA